MRFLERYIGPILYGVGYVAGYAASLRHYHGGICLTFGHVVPLTLWGQGIWIGVIDGRTDGVGRMLLLLLAGWISAVTGQQFCQHREDDGDAEDSG